MVIAGDMPFFEGRLVARLLTRRVMGWLRFAPTVVIFSLMAIGCGLGAWAADHGDDIGDTALAAGSGLFLIVVGVLVTLSNRMLRDASRRRWATRGVPAATRVAIRLTDEALRIEGVTATTIVPWRFVSELALDPRYLLFVVAGMAYFVPRRFFADPAEEAAFIAEAVTYLEPAALDRSAEAVAIVGRTARTP